ncbi:MAG: hypothetical protein HYV33_05800 [Candidatus Kerfeldbacteria bacterium]|nr:hypothetical protein [Candidatus Kerfeldbacteria bacterium]
MLMLPIGLMFLIIQIVLTVELERAPKIIVATIWLVYGAIVLWDFWNVRRVEQKLLPS